MRLLNFLTAIDDAAALVLPSVLPMSAGFVVPLVKHGIALAEHSIDAKSKEPLDGATKLQLATEATTYGIEAFNAHVVAKGGVAVDVDPDKVKDAISDTVDLANALVTAGASINTKMVQSKAVEQVPSVDALAASRSVTAAAAARPALL